MWIGPGTRKMSCIYYSMICKIGVPFRVPVIVAPANRSSMKRRTIYFNHAMIRRFSFTMAVFVPLVSFMISYAAGFNWIRLLRVGYDLFHPKTQRQNQFHTYYTHITHTSHNLLHRWCTHCVYIRRRERLKYWLFFFYYSSLYLLYCNTYYIIL